MSFFLFFVIVLVLGLVLVVGCWLLVAGCLLFVVWSWALLPNVVLLTFPLFNFDG